MLGKPKRPKGGWKIHEKQLQDLWDWINKERVLDGPGIQNTGNGKRIIWRADEFNPQFEPYFNRVNRYVIQLGIRPGYVYAAYDSGSSKHLPMVNQFPFEPKIGNSFLSAAPSPKLTLENSATNYIYLKLTWLSFDEGVGGFAHEGAFTFKVDEHNHGGGYDANAHVKITKRSYYLSEAEFISQTSDTPPTETENGSDITTNILSGWIKLDANGDLDTSTNDGTRWFLEGSIFANKNPTYITGESSPDRTEPVAPIASTGETIPGD